MNKETKFVAIIIGLLILIISILYLNSNQVKIGSTQETLLAGETYVTNNGYNITLEAIPLHRLANSLLYAIIRVDHPSGDFERKSITSETEETFFGGEITIYANNLIEFIDIPEGNFKGSAELSISFQESPL
jgi:hypothetical protein